MYKSYSPTLKRKLSPKKYKSYSPTLKRKLSPKKLSPIKFEDIHMDILKSLPNYLDNKSLSKLSKTNKKFRELYKEPLHKKQIQYKRDKLNKEFENKLQNLPLNERAPLYLFYKNIIVPKNLSKTEQSKYVIEAWNNLDEEEEEKYRQQFLKINRELKLFKKY